MIFLFFYLLNNSVQHYLGKGLAVNKKTTNRGGWTAVEGFESTTFGLELQDFDP